jgi:hypothetical protein
MADGSELDSQISQLVQAMATFANSNPGFDPETAVQAPNDATLQSASSPLGIIETPRPQNPHWTIGRAQEPKCALMCFGTELGPRLLRYS